VACGPSFQAVYEGDGKNVIMKWAGRGAQAMVERYASLMQQLAENPAIPQRLRQAIVQTTTVSVPEWTAKIAPNELKKALPALAEVAERRGLTVDDLKRLAGMSEGAAKDALSNMGVTGDSLKQALEQLRKLAPEQLAQILKTAPAKTLPALFQAAGKGVAFGDLRALKSMSEPELRSALSSAGLSGPQLDAAVARIKSMSPGQVEALAKNAEAQATELWEAMNKALAQPEFKGAKALSREDFLKHLLFDPMSGAVSAAFKLFTL